MKVGDAVATLEGIAPLGLAQPWDNVGLLVGDPDQAISRVLLTIDYTAAVANEARTRACDFVIAYHPPIFQPLKRILAGEIVFDAIRAGVSIYSPHTALDVAEGGTNDVLAEALGLDGAVPLRGVDAGEQFNKPAAVGTGRIGSLGGVSAAELLTRIKQSLGLSHVLVAAPDGAPAGRTFRRGAVCAGACGDHLRDAVAQGAEVYLTGELRHHDALWAVEHGMTVFCVLHSNSERATLTRLRDKLLTAWKGVDVHLASADRDPFAVR
jgi:dinuclear metal center YbgI/SA1388 family protein